MVPHATPVVNALFRQRACIENIFRACIGLQPQNHMLLEHKLPVPATAKRRSAVPVMIKQPVVKEERVALPSSAIMSPTEVRESF